VQINSVLRVTICGQSEDSANADPLDRTATSCFDNSSQSTVLGIALELSNWQGRVVELPELKLSWGFSDMLAFHSGNK
jgi:hypothetical protein